MESSQYDSFLVFTQAEDTKTFGVYLKGDGKVRKLTSLQVKNHVNELTVETSLAPTQERISLIPNFDTIAGTDLLVCDLKSKNGQHQLVDSGRITSAVWSASATKLAYAVLTDRGANIRISNGVQRGSTVAQVAAKELRLLGSSPDEKELYVVYSNQFDGFPLYTFSILDIASGKMQDIFVSHPKGQIYRDFRLVTMSDRSLRVSFIKSTTIWAFGGTSSLHLATVDGEQVTEYGVTQDSYSYAQWSADGTQVVYELRAYTDNSDQAKALESSKHDNGIYVADVASGKTQQIAVDNFDTYRIALLDGNLVHLTSPTRGLHQLDTASSKPIMANELEPKEDAASLEEAEQLAIGTTATASARNNPAVYIHQLWDTPDWFNGEWACGPTSAVMALASRYLGAWPIEVSFPYRHTSSHGRYVAEQYTYKGVTYSWTEPDASGKLAKGAYGYIVGNGLAQWNLLTAFLNLHVGASNVTQADPSWAGFEWVRDRINEGKLVIASGQVFGFGHLILIRGYTNDGQFVVNDPYGKNVGRGYDGANVIYSWNQISPKQFWAV